MGRSVEELTGLFRQLGAKDPESWARSEIEEKIPQLTRFLFMMRVWSYVVAKDDCDWVDRQLSASGKSYVGAYQDMAHAVHRMLEKGVDRQDIIDVARGAQVGAMDDVLWVMNNPDLDVLVLDPSVDMGWGLFESDLDYKAGRPVDGLHESFLSMDPCRSSTTCQDT